jgi:hypothetical protein
MGHKNQFIEAQYFGLQTGRLKRLGPKKTE